MGSDLAQDIHAFGSFVFQSTLPAWGATQYPSIYFTSFIFQSTLPAWGATFEREKSVCLVGISIHAPRMGSDKCSCALSRSYTYFNPRSPHGERRSILTTIVLFVYFNPRSPHGERPRRPCLCLNLEYFNPRSPHGERHHSGSNYETKF